MRKALYVFCLLVFTLFSSGCATLDGLFQTGVRETVDGITKKWILTSMFGIPAKFNVVTGEMWLLGADGWIRIDDDYKHRVGAKHIIPSLPTEPTKKRELY